MDKCLCHHTVSTVVSSSGGGELGRGAGGRVGREKAVEAGAWGRGAGGKRGGSSPEGGAMMGLGVTIGGAGGCRMEGAGVMGRKVRGEEWEGEVGREKAVKGRDGGSSGEEGERGVAAGKEGREVREPPVTREEESRLGRVVDREPRAKVVGQGGEPAGRAGVGATGK